MELEELTLEQLDVDGALQEAIAGLHGASRAQVLRTAAVGGAALFAALAAPAVARAARARDKAILNYALVLEYMQASFYTEVERMGVLRGELARQARTVGAHERAHVRAFHKVLGSAAVKRPFFDFRGATESAARFRKTAVAFEDLAVGAYKGQAPLIDNPAYLAAAISIHSVEARHAAWIRRLAGFQPAAKPFDEPLSKSRTLQIVDATHFIVATRGRGSPRFTG
jgi:hypothetical protein